MLQETKLSDLNNTKKMKTHKDLQRAAHSQGYELSDKRQDDKYGSHSRMTLTHRKTGEELRNDRNKEFGGHDVGKDSDTSTVNTISKAIKAHINKIGRQDKRPAAKEKRKEEARANKERKARDRDPFTRTKTYESFIMECATF